MSTSPPEKRSMQRLSCKASRAGCTRTDTRGIISRRGTSVWWAAGHMRGENLTRYLEDGRLELSNNRAERSMKPFVMGGKNWLFANTPGGAQASSVIYSLIETAKENGLDPYRYLLWLLQNAPQLSETNKAWAESLLPANAPEECHMPHK